MSSQYRLARDLSPISPVVLTSHSLRGGAYVASDGAPQIGATRASSIKDILVYFFIKKIEQKLFPLPRLYCVSRRKCPKKMMLQKIRA